MSKGVKILVVLVVLAGLTVAGYFLLQNWAKGKAEENVAAFFQQAEGLADAQYGEVEVDLLGRAAVIHDMQLSVMGGKSFFVQEFVLRKYEEELGWPTAMNFSVRGVEVPVTEANMENAYQTFSDLGIESVTLDFDMAYAFDQDDDSFELSDLSLKLRGLGALGLSLKLENADFRTLVVTEGASALALALSEAEIRFEDSGLMDISLRATALEEGKTPEQMLEEGLAALDMEIERARQGGNDKAVEGLETVKEFLQDPGTLAITLRPKHPVGFMGLAEMQDFVTAADTLNINIEAR